MCLRPRGYNNKGPQRTLLCGSKGQPFDLPSQCEWVVPLSLAAEHKGNQSSYLSEVRRRAVLAKGNLKANRQALRLAENLLHEALPWAADDSAVDVSCDMAKD